MGTSIIWHARDGVWSYEGGNVTQAGFGSRVNWIYNPKPPPPRRATLHSRNSHVSSASCLDNSVYSHSQSVPKRKNNENKMPPTATRKPLAVPLSPAPPKKCRIRRR